MKIYTYRFMWRLSGSDNICFKIVTDTSEGLKQFEDSLLKLENIELAGKEYLHEYDCSKLGLFESIFKKEEIIDEKI